MSDHQMSREEFQRLILSLEEMPSRVRRLVESLGDGESRWKPGPDEFSATENVCHLLDIEAEGYAVRIQKLLNESEPFLNDLDGARLALERDYNNQNMIDALERLTDVRSSNVAAVRDLSPEGLNHRGIFEGVGPVTLGQLLSMMLEHDEGHIRELENLRARLLEIDE
jgi:hypothetical protein